MTQGIRPSQFITTYGPGAILEGPRGPRIIPDADIGLLSDRLGIRPDDYRIDDERMSNGLLEGYGIYRLPTNAELGLESDRHVYETRPFPCWKVCADQHGGSGSLLYEQLFCPICRRGDGRNAVGFVMACRNGHLDDIDWERLVHYYGECKRTASASIPRTIAESSAIFWRREGPTLASVQLVCPRCEKTRKFSSIYYGEHLPCSGRHPQRRSRDKCDRHARVINRQAANLHLPEIRTLLSIRSTYTDIHLAVQDPLLKVMLAGRSIESNAEWQKMICNPEVCNIMRPATVEVLRNAKWEDVLQARKDVKTKSPDTYHGLLMDEFSGLHAASIGGAPPRTGPPPRSRVLFELDSSSVTTATASGGHGFTIAPVQTLRAVTVQKGFRRDIPESKGVDDPPKLVRVSYTPPGDTRGWYPGVELFGEGIFIRLEDNDGWADNPEGSHAEHWLKAWRHAGSYPSFTFRDAERSRDELHPGFFWWHTLSHLLVRVIGEDAGYSAASIRERVYIEAGDGRYRGGILLYATQPGSDGTLGGLIALAPHMERILRIALERSAACSGDPLCIKSRLAHGDCNGASCYACTMNSETSCEHRNMWLDRGVLLDNLA